MSRSRKKAILKDNGSKKIYWKTIRRVVKHTIKKYSNEKLYDISIGLNYGEPEEFGWDDYRDEKELEDMIKQPKEMIDDYTYCDYTIDFENEKWDNEEYRIKNRRK